ncbi:MAG: ATP-binding protein [Chloroflexota bacterium]
MKRSKTQTALTIFSVFSLLVLLLYTYARIFVFPLLGFHLDRANGCVGKVYVDVATGPTLREGDELLSIDGVSWDDLLADRQRMFFAGLKAGDTTVIQVQRGSQVLTVNWVLPAPSWGDIQDRLVNSWWVAYVFWFFGILTLVLVRPRDERWALLVIFNFLTSIWLIAGTTAYSYTWYSAIVLRATIWLSVPVYFHLHWLFPQSLGRMPRRILWALYLLALLLALAEPFLLLPADLYAVGVLLAFLSSISLLLVHAWRWPEQRRDLSLLGFLAFLFVLPSIVLVVVDAFAEVPSYSGGVVFFFVLLPAVYFYTIYRRQWGMQVRADQIMIWIVFALVAIMLSVIAVTITNAVSHPKSPPPLLWISALLLADLAGASWYPAFKSWVERRFLGMPLPPTELVGLSLQHITTSLERQHLVRILRDELLPSLLVRQAALLRLRGFRDPASPVRLEPVFTLDVMDEQLPRPQEVAALLAHAGRAGYAALAQETGLPCPWAYLILVLRVEDRPIGLLLLGRRDPDDFYAPNEIPLLQTLVDQTALALLNVEQAGDLRAFYQENIARQEAERLRLARGLHDDVLAKMAQVAHSASARQEDARFTAAYESAVDSLRAIVNNLRPKMLDFGLRSALDELIDDLQDSLATETPRLELDVPPSAERYPPEVELHLFRIVQQAAHNALRHAQAQQIAIRGSLLPGKVELLVQDDGVGFEASGGLDLASLLKNRHFGLVGMHERAALIDAGLWIDSQPGQGSRIHITWEPKN